MSRFALVALALLVEAPFLGRALKFSLQSADEATLETLKQYSFTDFVKDYNRNYDVGSAEWVQREKLFSANLKDIAGFQEQKGRSYSKGINQFMDYTPEEFKAMLGYKGMGQSQSTMRVGSGVGNVSLPSAHSVIRTNVSHSLSALIRDQGACGSCWAEAATAVLEGHLELKPELLARMAKFSTQDYQTLSSQAVVSCTPNPRHCGGTGGCQGATVELAYDMVQERGLPLAEVLPYKSSGGFSPACVDSAFSHAKLGITGYTTLPRNKHGPLLEALVRTNGPIAVTVAAGAWSFYNGGIFTERDFDVNHAVVLVGYQMPDHDHDGWYKIKNSWGTWWGEDGYIRVSMTMDEDKNCGWTHRAHDGIACEGDPDDSWVCGSSGVLYDSVYPEGLHFIDAAGSSA